jgi:hypothetical protein
MHVYAKSMHASHHLLSTSQCYQPWTRRFIDVSMLYWIYCWHLGGTLQFFQITYMTDAIVQLFFPCYNTCHSLHETEVQVSIEPSYGSAIFRSCRETSCYTGQQRLLSKRICAMSCHTSSYCLHRVASMQPRASQKRTSSTAEALIAQVPCHSISGIYPVVRIEYI